MSGSPLRPVSSGRAPRLALAVLLAAVTLAVFWPAVHFDFLNFDDDWYVAGNPAVRNGLSLSGIRWAFTTVHENWWLPALWISYMADTSVWGPGPFGYHLTNLLLHALNAALLFWLLSRMTGSVGRSLFVAALFALHPLRAESVAWIAARKDVLSGLFFFLALLAYLRHAARPSAARLSLVALAMLLGLLSKAIVVVLPVLLLLLDYWPLRRAGDPLDRAARPRWRALLLEKIPLFALAAAFAVLNLHTHQAAGPAFARVPPLDRLGLVFPNLAVYLRQFAWPARLAIFHPEHDAVHWPLALAALAGLLAAAALAFRLRRRHPDLLVGGLWFFVALLPVLRGIRLGFAAFADRFAYLPAIGLGLVLAWSGADLVPRIRFRNGLRAALAALILVACTLRTRAVLPLFADSLSAFANVLRLYPDHPMPRHNYAQALLAAGRPDDALPHFERIVADAPHMAPFEANRALALLLLGRPDDALARLEAARLRLDPESPVLLHALALAWLEKGEPRRAIPLLQRALAREPAPPVWWLELARACRDDGRLADFDAAMRRAAAAGLPQLAGADGLQAYYWGLWEDGHARRAWTFFRREIETRPDDIPLLNNAAWYLATRPPPGIDPAEAVRLADQACAAGGDHPQLLDTRAAALAAAGRFDDAIAAATRARDLAQAAGDAAFAAQIARRLDSYRQHRPWP